MTSNEYTEGARVLAHSLHLQNTFASLILAYIPERLSPYSLCVLTSAGWTPRPVSLIPAPTPAPGKKGVEEPRFQELFTKLNVWQWDDEFDHVLVIDADTLVVGNVDEVFGWDLDFAAVQNVWPDRLNDDQFNGGVFYLRPNRAVFEDMLVSMQRDVDKYDLVLSEQAFLNYYFGYTSHRLPHRYNLNLALAHHPHPWSQVWPEKIIIHYTNIKPFWAARPAENATGLYDAAVMEWWKVMDDLKMSVENEGARGRVDECEDLSTK